MMILDNLVEKAKQYFPNLKIDYKDQSNFMKITGKLLFFNKSFMTSYTTTVGSTIYFPDKDFVKIRPISSSIILLHELVHLYDAKRFSTALFSFLYLTPQILSLLSLPLIFISWKISLIFLLFAAPLPSYFRMYFEKRAYFASLYIIYFISNKLDFNSDLETHKNYFLTQFKTGYYYFMWVFKNLDKEFSIAIEKINNKERPFDDPVFDMLDDLMSQISKEN